ncbi:hypothetical protein [Catenuloplanes japonicus]|uniref:hypothetical protein n=1 Tax=Catenuloplanes japonicus TaxID=33876 RepID=UPI000526733B|nr:hypothetical protein [Catenuloplanes japonicus]
MGDSSVAFARRELRRGADVRDVFAWLAGNGRSARQAARAVCLALGVDRAEAERRLAAAGLRDEGAVEADLVEDLADLLAASGLFAPPP